MIYKIVQGNSFKLHVLVRKMDVSKEFQRLIDFDMNLATDISVELHGCFCDTDRNIAHGVVFYDSQEVALDADHFAVIILP